MAGVKDRVALVTGGSRGIGRATADILVSRGARMPQCNVVSLLRR